MSGSHTKGRIGHFVAAEATSVTECLSHHFGLDRARMDELFNLGAIYMDKRRVFADRPLAKGAYLRVHLQPKRFSLEGIDWRAVIRHEDQSFFVVDKPAGVPVHASVDNQLDNVLHQLRLVTGKTVLVTQRLDTPTAGLVVLAKSPEFQRRFNALLVERKVSKRYRALTVDPPPVGLHVHFMEPSERSPKVVKAEAPANWIRCELTVCSVTPRESDGQFDVEVDLHTGRTHQIRAQLSALGMPVVGDRMYGSRARYGVSTRGREAIALYCAYLAWPEGKSSRREFSAQPPWTQPAP